MVSGLTERAGEQLAANTRTGELAGRRFVFTAPSLERYPFQWFWDSCFHAIVWARIDLTRAQEELRSLFAAQHPDGLLPHVVFWDRALLRRLSWQTLESRSLWLRRARAPLTTALMQPPVVAQAVEVIVEAGAAAFLGEALPVLERYYRHLASRRDPDGDALISIITQFESGLDYSPVYDTSLPPTLGARAPQLVNKLVDYRLPLVFRLNPRHTEDVFVNSVYADGLQTLARLAKRAGDGALEGWATTQATHVRDRLLERCLDERTGLFFNLVGRRERRVDRVKTVGALAPLLLADLPTDVTARLLDHLTSPAEFWSPYPVPSVALDEPSFRPDSLVDGQRRIWRGPASPPTNWLLVRALRQHGCDDVAAAIAERSRAMAERSGFDEFYNPLDGAAAGTPRFGWGTLLAVLQS